MAITFNPLTSNFDITGSTAFSGYKAPVATEASLPSSGNDAGDMRVSADTDYAWVWDDTSSRWINQGIKSATFGSTPGSAGYSLDYVNVSTNRKELRLTLQPADATNPGGITTGSQTFAGTKTFNGIINAAGGVDVASGTLTIGGTNASTINIGHSGVTVNILGDTTYEQVTNLQVADKLVTINKGGGSTTAFGSGIETEENGSITGYVKTSADRNSWSLKAPNTAGDVTLTPGASGITLNQSSHDPVTLGAVGSSPNSNGASLSSQVLTLQPANGSNPGVITSGTQTIGGAKTFSSAITGDLNLSTISGATYSTVQHLMNLSLSSGRSSGGVISDAGGATVNITAGTGFIKATDSDVATLSFFNWSASNGNSIPSNSVRYIGVQYNSGSPNVVIKTSDSWDLDTDFPLGTVVNESGTLYIYNTPFITADNQTNLIERFDSLSNIARDNRTGGLILGNTGTRKVTVSAGSLLARMSEYSISAIDTSASSTFDAYYRDGAGGWTKQSGLTQWSNTLYDNNSGTLASIPLLGLVSSWFYLMLDGTLAMVYGQSTFTSLATVLTDSVPSSLPNRIQYGGMLIGRIIGLQAVDAPQATQTVFTTNFSSNLVQNHNDLANIQGGAAGTYYHVTAIPVPIAEGGTNATTAANARTNLGVLAKSSGDIAETSFTAADNQSSAANITGFSFANGTVRAFNALVSVVRSSTYAQYTFDGVQKGSSWDMNQSSVGDTTGLTFTITTAGQIQYTSTSTGSTATVKFRAITTSV